MAETDHTAISHIQQAAGTLRGKTGRAFWRSLDELAEAPAFRAALEAEFPSLAPAAGVDRRAMLKVMAASLALAGLTGCSSETDDEALPYVEAPENVVPGKAKRYASAVTMMGYAQPVLGITHAGRPVKLEGNPEHPASMGASDAFTQAALLGLYDPDRSQAPRFKGRISTWAAFDRAMADNAGALNKVAGRGFRLLTGSITSPTLALQIEAFRAAWPEAGWHVFEPLSGQSTADAAVLVFGRALDRHMRFDLAEAVVSLDDDFLGPGPRQTLHGRLWSKRRLAFQRGTGECALTVAEPTPSMTGVVADRRLIAPAARIPIMMNALAAKLGMSVAGGTSLDAAERLWIENAAGILDRHRGRSLLTVGSGYAAEAQALALLVNERLGNFGATLRFTEPVIVTPTDERPSFETLLADMAKGEVHTLAMLEANPVYAAAGDFGALLEQVPLRLHAGLYYDETAALSHWHAPLQHELESWGDARAVDGTTTIVQPLVKPFYDVRSRHALLANWTGGGGSDHDIVRQTWMQQWGDAFVTRWPEALYRGFVPGSAAPEVAPSLLQRELQVPTAPPQSEVTILIRPDPTIWDGRYGNNSWLQELSKPISKIVWQNALCVSPTFAEQRKLENGAEITVSIAGRTITGPIWIIPGQDPSTIQTTLGYGRRRAGRVIDGLGFDANRLASRYGEWQLSGASIAPTGRRVTVANTQPHHAIDGFDFVHTMSAREARKPAEAHDRPPSFYPQRECSSPSWGMSIDLDLCIGCNACVVACQAENNIPVVGKDLVAQGREMHWIRIDHYYEGDPAEPEMYFQPVPCMHCEQAPCEMGCPVNAAIHSFDGLNLQVYNRCIGTRTCSSFCPYKVRRFNWFDFTKDDAESLRAMRNPEVTVRQRGVMEKCTYCVQRISAARIDAKKEGREIRDGEVVTACQQACPTTAIVFGNVLDPSTEVSVRKSGARDYALLKEVNTQPRTTYLARIRPDEEKSRE